jgi:hypothetical protein
VTDLNPKSRLGGGTFADVYGYTDLKTKAKYAVKCYKPTADEAEIQ